MVSPSEPSKVELGELLGCGHMEIWGEGDSKRAWKSTTLSCLSLFHLAVPELYPL